MDKITCIAKMEKHNNVMSLNNLPDELITLILVNNEPRDIISFGATCKQFHEIVSNNDYLWKRKYSEIISNASVVKLVSKLNDGKWLTEIINFYKVKQIVCTELLAMSPQCYWRTERVLATEVRGFFAIANESKLNYYYTIYVLQEIVKKGNDITDKNQCLKPLYTLTTVYYATLVLSYLIHSYLALKWLQKHVRNELTPVFVTNFFLQWIDVTKIYGDEDVERKIDALIKKVKVILGESSSKLKPLLHTGEKKYTEKQLLHAISKAIYNNNVSSSPSMKTLNIVQILDEEAGNIISLGAIYQVVANYFGLKCELIAFPNHLFLEWQSTDEPNNPLYTIDLYNGEIKPKRRCPFAHGVSVKHKYCPDSLLQFILSSYIKSRSGLLRNYKTRNADCLYEAFFGVISEQTRRPYKAFFLHLVAQDSSPGTSSAPVNLKYMEEKDRNMIMLLSGINESQEGVKRPNVIKKHHKTVMYAVGLICYHTIHNFVCVVRGWEVDGYAMHIQCFDKLQYGKNQPFYRVMAGRSERFVAQENLRPVNTPFRMQNLDYFLAKDFTHFDGFSYVPNEEKLIEYPDETQYIEVFKKFIPNLR